MKKTTHYIDELLKDPLYSLVTNLIRDIKFNNFELLEYLSRSQAMHKTVTKCTDLNRFINIAGSGDFRLLTSLIQYIMCDCSNIIVMSDEEDEEEPMKYSAYKNMLKNSGNMGDVLEEGIAYIKKDNGLKKGYKMNFDMLETFHIFEKYSKGGTYKDCALIYSHIGSGMNLIDFSKIFPAEILYFYWNPDIGDDYYKPIKNAEELGFKVVYNATSPNILSENNRVILLKNNKYLPF